MLYNKYRDYLPFGMKLPMFDPWPKAAFWFLKRYNFFSHLLL